MVRLFASFQKDPPAAKKLSCNKLSRFEFLLRNLAQVPGMRHGKAAIFALVALFGMGTSALAMRVPFQDHLSLQYPGAPKPVREEPASPYAMTYTDEVARSLGVQDGHMDFFSTKPSSGLMPSFSAGVDQGGAMLRLKWRPGQ